MAAVKKLRELLAEKDKIIVCPGVYDGLTARIALNAGFDCLYMTGAGTTMSRLGMPDLGIATLNDMRDNAAMIASLNPRIPLIADADTGFGGPVMVGRTVTQYIRAGVAAFHIEDQVVQKRCGHLANKEIVDEDEFYSRIRAAVNARAQSEGDIVIIARTDSIQSLGCDAAVKRLKRAVELGADVVFPEGLTSKEDAKRVCQELAPTPVLLNNVLGGVTPHFTASEAAETGFKLIIYPGLALGAVFQSVSEAVNELKETGDILSATKANKNKFGPKELFTVCGLRECMAFDMAAGGKSYDKGV
ncbi:Pyruvate/Phosphoenolpyruvate kinase-like domain-containing protein [Xylogone sp. PMI_703]|nr:Pyruvate/Phosphoenolpyruvate kinase-like domain-containing protein [Xylogone sp. PMI_703]